MADRFDLDAIDADDALLDLLAAGGESARTAGGHDPAVKLLADLRLAVEVEDELPVETIDDPESFLARCAALNPVTDPFARKVATRGLALGVAAVAALSVSGVAAAVTGDPLSPYEKVIEKMVDAVRPQTSFPAEQLDGMPVVDKSKIVKVSKDFKKKQEAKAEEQRRAAADEPTEVVPASVETLVTPPPQYNRPPLPVLPMAIEDPIAPETADPTKLPEQVDDEQTDDEQTTGDPTAEPTDDPTEQPTQEPSEPPVTTPPPDEPSDPPATPEPSDPPPTTTPPPNGETGAETGANPTPAPSTPTTVPGDNQGSDQAPGSGTGESGDDSPSEDQLPADSSPADDSTPADTNPPADSNPPADDQKQPPADEEPARAPLTDLLEKLLPTSTGGPVEVPGVKDYSGDGVKAEGKHSNGKLTTGSVKKTYAKGKHSSGRYAEGKHAAIARAHGSTASPDVLKILGVVNKPTT